jgi:TfoX/Sxy family transcriptional regulator of competence genes
MLCISLFLIAAPFVTPRLESYEQVALQNNIGIRSQIGEIAILQLSPIFGIVFLVFVLGRWHGSARDRLLLELSERIQRQ